MKVYLKKDIKSVGMAGEIVKVSDGYGMNYLLPRNLAVQITTENETFYTRKRKTVDHRKEVIATETSMLAERIKSLHLTLKKKMHDNNKLYGAVSAVEVVELFAQQGIKIAKSQVIFNKSIKEKGDHAVTIKLSSRLQPLFTLTVGSEK